MPICRAVAACAALLACTLVLSPAQAATPMTPKAALARLFQQPVESQWFSPAFLSQVPASRVTDIIGQLTAGTATCARSQAAKAISSLNWRRPTFPHGIALDDQGRIRTLLFKTAIAAGATLKDGTAAIAALPGRTSVLVTTGGDTVAANDPEAVLAVGSAAKLAILAAVDDAVAAGRLSWDQVVS